MVLGMKSKEEKEFEKNMNMQEQYSESSDESMVRDRDLNYASNMMPESQFEWKKLVNIPESQAEFIGKIDKDVVFANLGGSKPTIEELRFQIGTIELFEGEFVEEKEIEVVDSDGNRIIDVATGKPLRRKIMVFDEAFRSCLNFLKAEYKFDIVASRAIGNIGERAAGLDTMTTTRIQKEFSKGETKKNNTFGMGGI
jgi:hypothetical protein